MGIMIAVSDWKTEKYASMFGLDETSGVEIGVRSKSLIQMQFVLQSDRGTNNYTVSQLNRYVTAVANRGNRI